MTALFLIWYGMGALALLFGVVVGMTFSEWLNRTEQPDTDADTARLDVLL